MKNHLCICLFLTLLSACGSEKNSDNAQIGGSDQYAEIESTAPEKSPALVALYAASRGAKGGFVAFYTGNRYAAGLIAKANARRARSAAILGNYVTESNGTIRQIPRRTTCPQLFGSTYRGKTFFQGAVGDDSIIVQTESASIVMEKIMPDTSVPAGGIAIEWGCFQSDQFGIFTRHAWVDVQ